VTEGGFTLKLGLDQANVLRDALEVYHTVQAEIAAAKDNGDDDWMDAQQALLAIEQIERQMGVHRPRPQPD
jgi:hypothetical protein